MMTLKHRTANPFGTHRLWLSKCLTNNTGLVSKFDLQSPVNITAVTAYKNFHINSQGGHVPVSVTRTYGKYA